MALPLGWNWLTVMFKSYSSTFETMPDAQTSPHNIFTNFGQNPIRQYNQYLQFVQFSPTETAPVHDLDRYMLAFNDNITFTIE